MHSTFTIDILVIKKMVSKPNICVQNFYIDIHVQKCHFQHCKIYICGKHSLPSIMHCCVFIYLIICAQEGDMCKRGIMAPRVQYK